ncbi:MAG: hypothetical protein DMF37_04900 [Verrucomicrobia bacterium]|nr:MAG: hypothetical protein DMF37_04900 [Verrucomicrobiota bacterium]
MKILAQIILALMIFFCGCHKKQVVHQSPPFDPLKEFLRTHGEHIQLLAIKYQIPKGKAEKIAWEYYGRHDLAYSYLRHNKVPDVDHINDDVSKTISELAAANGLTEQTVAGFLADMRLFEGSSSE